MRGIAWHKKWGVRTKVSLWSLISMVWVIVLGGVGLLFIDRVAQVSLSLVDTQAVPLIEAGRLEGMAWEIYVRAMLHAGLNNNSEMEKLDREMVSLATELHAKLEADGKDPNVSQEWLAALQKKWDLFASVTERAKQLSRSYAKEEAIQLLFGEGRQAFDAVLATVKGEEGQRWQQMTVLRGQAGATQAEAIRWTAGIALLFGLVVLAGWWYARFVSASLSQVANDLATSVAQMSATVSEQERIIAQQAASVNQTSTTMEELGHSARQSAEQADAAAMGTQEAIQFAEQGITRVTETLRSMENTQARMDDMARQIQLLSEQTGQIREITDLVADFANETKMLAMNAAVEAVRAGEHGKGFSVLAVETRKLADESKRSVAQINEQVARIQQATQTTVQVAEEGSKSVRAGIAITRSTAKTFESLGETVSGAAHGTQQISLNVRQQSVAIKQVVEAIKSINDGARESALGITQVKTGIQTLHEAAQTLRNMI
ncbi:MAG: MCP four helix bundle domain-containing protein [Magnetococcales bacterium]|nr:MCP four helix bundle domain-containing protein [Magnetococcales bacterium]